VSLHAIDAASGALGAPRHVAVGKNPNWVEIVDLP
jgi:6-phosphogluconolactonase